MADKSLLPPLGEGPEIDPEVVGGSAKRARPNVWDIPVVRKAAIAISFAGLAALAGWLFSNFLQLRGVVNLAASRIDLGFLWATATLAVFLVTTTAKRRVLVRWTTGIVFLVGVFWLDAWAPKPPEKEERGRPSSGIHEAFAA